MDFQGPKSSGSNCPSQGNSVAPGNISKTAATPGKAHDHGAVSAVEDEVFDRGRDHCACEWDVR